MRPIKYENKFINYKEFYKLSDKPLMPDEWLSDKIDYNYLVANQLKQLGFIVTQELSLPEWGIADIFAYKDKEIIIAECKSEKDRNLMRALGQIITYSLQLHNFGYKISHAIIFARFEPTRQRIKKDLAILNKFLPFEIYFKRVSKKTPLINL